jgi:hypothetical protein
VAIKEANENIEKRRAEGDKEASLDDYHIPPPPFKYSVLKYRQRMEIGYEEAVRLPHKVMYQDIEMLNIEADFSA